MKITGIDEEFAIYGMLFSLSNRIQTIGDKELKGITLKQQFMMVAIGMFKAPPTLKETAQLIGCSYQNVKRMAEHLQKEEFLEIVQDCNDKRKQLLVSTGKIEKEAKSSREKTISFMSELYKNIPRENLVITLKTLMKMDQNIGGTIIL